MRSSSFHSNRLALALNVSAYLLWASATLLFKRLEHLPVWQVFAQRVLWSLLFCLIILACYQGFGELRSLLRQPRRLILLPLTSVLIASNWLLVIWAVDIGRLQDASLGYFLAPLFSLLLAKLCFKEPWRSGEPICLLLCLLGVALAGAAAGLHGLPWIGLLIAVTFACYSALKKVSGLSPLDGLSLETLVVAVPAGLFLLANGLHQRNGAAYAPEDHLLLLAVGLVTTLPMLFYVISVRQLSLTTIGQLQYLNPSLMFLLAVLVFDEPLSGLKLAGFGLIWTALLYQMLVTARREPVVLATTKLGDSRS
jgi:chloramphenicol-sensitive protein RarD